MDALSTDIELAVYKRAQTHSDIAIKSNRRDTGLLIVLSACREDHKSEHSELKISAVLFRILMCFDFSDIRLFPFNV